MESKSAVARTGCIWDSKPVTYSDDTKNLLREFMRESKLTFAQQRKLKETVDKTGMLPPPKPPNKPKTRRITASAPKVLNPKNYSGGVRTQEKIVSSGDLSRPQYRPNARVAPRTDADKERLAHIMAFGLDSYNEKGSAKAFVGDSELPDDFEEEEVDRFDELCREVEERKSFLAEMGKIGKDKMYRTEIETEISQKLREMEVIDKKRSLQLNQFLAN